MPTFCRERKSKILERSESSGCARAHVCVLLQDMAVNTRLCVCEDILGGFFVTCVQRF